MGLRKFGTGDGKIIPEEQDDQKIAQQAWSPDDAKDLREENARED